MKTGSGIPIIIVNGTIGIPYAYDCTCNKEERASQRCVDICRRGRRCCKRALPNSPRPKPLWTPRAALVSDGAGPAFGERGGLYGLHGVHGETSTRERLREFDNHCFAVQRIALWKKQQQQQQWAK